MEKQRIEWLDFMKAVAIFIVVLGHIGHRVSGDYPPFVRLVEFMEMPFFFMLSGILAGKVIGKPIWSTLIKKIKTLIVPFLTCGIPATIILGRFEEYINNQFHGGYWFLLSLTTCWICFLIMQHFARLFGTFVKNIIVQLILLHIPFYIYVLCSKYIPDHIDDLLSLNYTFTYYRFFLLGYFVYTYIPFERLQQIYSYGIHYFIVVFISVLYLKGIEPSVSLVLIRILFVLSFFGLLWDFHKSLPHWMMTVSNYVGTRTLGIYVFHYLISPWFVLVPFKHLSSGFMFLTAILITAIVIAFTLLFMIPIENNKYLRFVFLGK